MLTYHEALLRAQSLCVRGEQCAFDIQRKALDWGLAPDEARRLTDELTADHFIDEARYVHAFVNDRYHYQHWGRQKIAFALRQKRLPDALVRETLDEVIGEEEYLDACINLLRAKMRTAGIGTNATPAERQKLCRFAAQRGFEAGIIFRALDQLKLGDEDDF